MPELNSLIVSLITNIVTDTIIINTIWNSLSNNVYKICFCGVISLYLINKYI
jgi:hypothetical protein